MSRIPAYTPVNLDDLNAEIANDRGAQTPAKREPSPLLKAEPDPGVEKSFLKDAASSWGRGVGGMVDLVGAGLEKVGADRAGAFVKDVAKTTEEYWQGNQSDYLTFKQKQLAQLMVDPNVSAPEIAKWVATEPYLASQIVAGSMPDMMAGMGVGAAAGVGIKALRVAHLTKAAAGASELTGIGSRVAGGIGEGTIAGAQSAKETGSAGAGAGNFLLGVATNIVTPGNVTSAGVRKLTGEAAEDTVESALNRTVGRRVAGSLAGEGSQEWLQSGGESVINQFATTGEVDMGRALKDAALGGIVGAGTGVSLHPIVGEGAPQFKSKEALETYGALTAARSAAEAAPDDVTLQQDVSRLSTQFDRLQLGLAADIALTENVREEARASVPQASTTDEAIAGFTAANAAAAENTAARRAGAATVGIEQGVAEAQGTLVEDPDSPFAPETPVQQPTPTAPTVAAPTPVAVQPAGIVIPSGGSSVTEVAPTAAPLPTIQAEAPAPVPVAVSPTAPYDEVALRRSMDSVAARAAGLANELGNAPVMARELQALSEVAANATSAGDLANVTDRLHTAVTPIDLTPEQQTAYDGIREDLRAITGAQQLTVGAEGDPLANRNNTIRDTLIQLAAGNNRPVASLAARLMRAAPSHPAMAMPMTYSSTASSRLPRGVRGMVTSNPRTGEVQSIRMSGQISTESAALHEIIHAMTLSWLARTPDTDPLKQEFNRLYRHVSAQPEVRGAYGLTNHAEFLAELARPTFQNQLAKISPVNGRFANALQEVLDIVRRIIGSVTGQPISNSAMTQALGILEEIVQQPATARIRPAWQNELEMVSDSAALSSGQQTVLRRLSETPAAGIPASRRIVADMLAVADNPDGEYARLSSADRTRLRIALREGLGAIDREARSQPAQPEQQPAQPEQPARAGDRVQQLNEAVRFLQDDLDAQLSRGYEPNRNLYIAVLNRLRLTPADVIQSNSMAAPRLRIMADVSGATDIQELASIHGIALPPIEEAIRLNNERHGQPDTLNENAQRLARMASGMPLSPERSAVVSLATYGMPLTDDQFTRIENLINALAPVATTNRQAGESARALRDVARARSANGDALDQHRARINNLREIPQYGVETQPRDGYVPPQVPREVPPQAPREVPPADDESYSVNVNGYVPDLLEKIRFVRKLGINELRDLNGKGDTEQGRAARRRLEDFINIENPNAPEAWKVELREQLEDRLRIKNQGDKSFRETLSAIPQDRVEKLGEWFLNAMGGKGQSMLPANIGKGLTPIAANARSGQQLIATSLMKRYNAAMKKEAQKWAAANNQTFDESSWVNPITSVDVRDTSSKGTTVYHRGLNRGEGKNPFMVDPRSARSAALADRSSNGQWHANATSVAEGSGDLIYRYLSDYARLNSSTLGASSALLTSNRYRRQLNSLASDALVGPNATSPLTYTGDTSPQGVPAGMYERASEKGRVGINLLRAIYSTFTARTGSNPQQDELRSRAQMLSNLRFRRGAGGKPELYAKGEANAEGGFEDGTVVSEEALRQKLNERRTFARWPTGGVSSNSVRLAAMGQTALESMDADGKIPDWMTKVFREEGRNIGGWFFSEENAMPEGELDQALTDEVIAESDLSQDEFLAAFGIHPEDDAATHHYTAEEATPEQTAQLATVPVVVEGEVATVGVSAPEVATAEEAAVPTSAATPPPTEIKIASRFQRNTGSRVADNTRQVLQDKDVSLGHMLRALGIGRENVAQDTLGAIDRFSSSVMHVSEELVEVPMRAIQRALEKAAVKLNKKPGEVRGMFEEFLIARHAPAYNEYVARINPARFDARGQYIDGFDLDKHPGSGMSNDKAASIVAAINSSPAVEFMQDAEEAYRQMIHEVQEYSIERGIERRSTVDNWRALFPNYTPLNRDIGAEEVDGFSDSTGISTRAGISRHRAMGSSAEVQSPLANTMLLGLRVANRGETAVVGRTLLNLARAKTPQFMNRSTGKWENAWQVNTFPMERTTQLLNIYHVIDPQGNAVAMGNGQPMEFYNRAHAQHYASARFGARAASVVFQGTDLRVVNRQTAMAQLGDNVLSVPENGSNNYIVFNKNLEEARNIYENLRNLNTTQVADWLKPAQAFSRWVTGTSTGYNPVFMFFNFARDIQGAVANIGADKIPGWKTSDSLALPKQALQSMPGIYRRLKAQARHKLNGTAVPPAQQGSNEWWLDRMVEHGGVTGFRDSIDGFDAADERLRRIFGQEAAPPTSFTAPDLGSRVSGATERVHNVASRWLEGDVKNPAAKLSSALPVLIDRANSTAELATRLAAFKSAFEKFNDGKRSEEEAFKLAANISKNISINFNKRGTLSSVMSSLFPFFNAAAQGSARLAKTLTESKVVKKKDHMGNEYLDTEVSLSPYGKKIVGGLSALGGLQAMLLMAAGFDDEEPPDYIRDRNFIIPVGAGKYVAVPMPYGLNVPFNMTREAVMGMANPDDMVEHFSKAVGGIFEGFNPLGGAGNIAQTLAPAILDPVVALSTNTDAFGRRIAKEDFDKNDPTPGYTRGKEGSSEVATSIAKMINAISGGDEDRPGVFSPTPNQLEYLGGQVTGGVGREAGKAAVAGSNALRKLAGGEVEPMPWYRVPVVGRLYGETRDDQGSQTGLRTIQTDLNKLKNRYEGLVDRGDDAQAQQLLAEHPELRLIGSVNDFYNAEQRLRKMRVKLREEGRIDELNALNDRLKDRALELRQMYEDAVID